MRLKAVIHEADEGGLWAEIPDIPGCCAQGADREELLAHLKEAAEGCLLCRLATSAQAGDGCEPDLTVEISE